MLERVFEDEFTEYELAELQTFILILLVGALMLF